MSEHSSLLRNCLSRLLVSLTIYVTWRTHKHPRPSRAQLHHQNESEIIQRPLRSHVVLHLWNFSEAKLFCTACIECSNESQPTIRLNILKCCVHFLGVDDQFQCDIHSGFAFDWLAKWTENRTWCECPSRRDKKSNRLTMIYDNQLWVNVWIFN